MSRKLYVHVGPMKTGTSSIQDVLCRHDDSVIIYPKVGLWDDGSHHGLVFKFFGETPANKDVAGRIDDMFAEIECKARDSGLDVLISSETLAKRDCEAFIRALLPHVTRDTMEVEIVVACREHFSRASSLYNHKLRAGEPPDPDRFLQKHAAEMCYAPLIERLEKLPYRVVALNYHPSDTWLARFLDHVGFPEHGISGGENKRLALSPKAIVAKLAINNLRSSKEAKRQLFRHFKKMPGSRATSRFIFGPEASAVAERYFAPDREFLEHKFGIRFEIPAPEERENMLYISEDELTEIISVAGELGPQGRKIIRFARQYLRV